MLRRAKAYIKKHEVDRKQSKQAKDVVANIRTSIDKTINKFKREVANFIVTITPWEMRIKKIESITYSRVYSSQACESYLSMNLGHFGSVVASYFVFLRWVFWVNLFISVFICCFLMVPEILRGVDDGTGMRKEVEDANSSLKLSAVWEFEVSSFLILFFSPFSSSTIATIDDQRVTSNIRPSSMDTIRIAK